jgi:hypothetical protein
MQHAALVCVLERGAEGQYRRAGARGVDAGAGVVLERPAPEPLHHEQAEPVLLDVVVDRHDVDVAERGEELRLGHEAPPNVGVRGEVGGQQLDRHVPAELAVAGSQNHTGRAPPELLTDVIGRERAGNLIRLKSHLEQA